MEKSFNDEELSDIMKEIEALEEDFKGEKVKAEAKATPVIAELAKMQAEDAVPLKSEVVEIDKKAAPKNNSKGHSPACMQFKVEGDLNLDLKFEISGKVVNLSVSEKGLQLEMDGGMTFSIPLEKTNAKKSA